jgi:cell division septum initiation protein DivIVA
MTPTDFDIERAQQARIEELEARIAEKEKMYDKVAADLIEALDRASAYRATASTLHQEVERRNGVERRQTFNYGIATARGWTRGTGVEDRRKS